MHNCWTASGIEDDRRTRPSGTTNSVGVRN